MGLEWDPEVGYVITETDTKDREEIMNLASVQIAQEMYGELGTTDQLDLNDPEIVAKIQKRAIEIKQREYEGKEREENLVDLLQMDRTDIDWSDAAVFGLEMATIPVTGFLDAVLGDLYDTTDLEDVFESSKQNKNIDKYFDVKKKELSLKIKGFQQFQVNGETMLENI